MSIQGVQTNRAFLIRVLEHPIYLRGELSTHFIEQHLPLEHRGEPLSPDRDVHAAVAALLYTHLERRAQNALLPHIPTGWRNNRFRDANVTFKIGEETLELSYRALDADRYRVVMGFICLEVEVVETRAGQAGQAGHLRLEINGVQRLFRVTREGESLYVHSPLGSSVVTERPRFPELEAVRDPGDATAPMPGRVLRLRVTVGQHVRTGDALVTLEAMKMEHTLTAPVDGVVEAVYVALDDLVEAGARLVHVVAHVVAHVVVT